MQNGCNIGLDKWYIFLTGLACLKLLIEIWRYMFIKVHYQESMVIQLCGNYLIMPIAFVVFFIFTQTMFENANPDPSHVLTYKEAQHATLKQNVCVNGDIFSQSLYATF